MRWKTAIWLGLGLYALLSAADWTLTFALLRAHPGAFESNPVAAACLERHGWGGLALYKAGGVLMFVGAVYLLARRRPVVAAGVVGVGCAALLSVVTYTHGLICEAHQQRTLTAAGWPPTPEEGSDLIAIPETCWFASERPTDSRTDSSEETVQDRLVASLWMSAPVKPPHRDSAAPPVPHEDGPPALAAHALPLPPRVPRGPAR
jgi:hypothetical protein